MKYWEALVEWQGGGFDDIPTENLEELFKSLQSELKKRNALSGEKEIESDEGGGET